MEYTIPDQFADERLDKVLTALDNSKTRSQWQKTIEAEDVTVNKKPATKHTKVQAGDIVFVPKADEIIKNFPTPTYNLLQEEEDYVIVEKPSGIVVHPDDRHPKGNTLVDAVLADYPEIESIGEDPIRPGIVHRLDKDVSGVMVIARTQEMFSHLKNQFKTRAIHKEYTALLYGIPSIKEDDITFPIGRSKRTGKMAAKGAVDEKTKSAKTHYNIAQEFPPKYSLATITILTGRTHQIRVHMNALSHPVVGDALYTQKKFAVPEELNRIFLHATKLSFKDLTNERKTFISPLPESLETFLKKL
ncbi:MAG: RluA family pseudouridine synthase [Candidatus Jacksonbacteria bacterium]|nr:RluA family pseudouridine synthase [Candidatus Jacksonbacteria bacterium]MBT7008611.1 RluA family pseudouridine synthase [Candidatus Jacksonbacteria bacterium]